MAHISSVDASPTALTAGQPDEPALHAPEGYWRRLRAVDPRILSLAASLCLLHRLPGLEVTGIEAQAGLAALARRNAALNGVRLEVV